MMAATRYLCVEGGQWRQVSMVVGNYVDASCTQSKFFSRLAGGEDCGSSYLRMGMKPCPFFFFGPQRKVRSKEVAKKWEKRVDATLPRLTKLVASRMRDDYGTVGLGVLPLEIEHGTKRTFGKVGEDPESEEPTESKGEILGLTGQDDEEVSGW